MISLTSKICIVGDFAVGKTSVVERFVRNQFSEKYLTTVGVKIDTKELEFGHLGVLQKLVIWDVAGSDRFGDTEFAYLRGANGYIFVADGTRSATLDSIETIRAQIEGHYGPAPSAIFVNKKDLVADWCVTEERLGKLDASFDRVYRTSAKTGDEVEYAMVELAEAIIANDLRAT